MAREIEAQHGRFSCRYDEKRGFGSEIRNYVVKKFVGKRIKIYH